VFDNNTGDADYVLEKYNAVSPIRYGKSEDLAKVFGVQGPSDAVIRCLDSKFS
jgi:hypothetical protein